MPRQSSLKGMASLLGRNRPAGWQGPSALQPCCSNSLGALVLQSRSMGTGVSGMSDQTLTKARRLALAVGALAGCFGSLVGVGGGVLISPIIANACKTIPQRVISGTSLAAVAATGTAAGAVYWANGSVDLTSAALIAGAAITTTPLGARAAHAVDCAMLRRLMAYWLFAVAPLVPLKPYIVRTYGDRGRAEASPGAGAAGATVAESASSGSPAAPTALAAGPAAEATALVPEAEAIEAAPPLWRPLRDSDAVLVATGTLAGFASGLLGIGGGTVVTPLLTIATGLPQLSVLGTSLAAMVFPSLVGLTQHARLGNVDWRMAAGLAAGTVLGGSVGGRLAVAAPEGVLEWLFCAGMLFLGHKTLGQARASAAAAAAAAGAAKATGSKAVGASGGVVSKAGGAAVVTATAPKV